MRYNHNVVEIECYFNITTNSKQRDINFVYVCICSYLVEICSCRFYEDIFCVESYFGMLTFKQKGRPLQMSFLYKAPVKPTGFYKLTSDSTTGLR